jgi:hypothetical protein
MIPSLLRLPAASLGRGALDVLAELVASLSAGRLVVVGAQRTAAGGELDAFTVAAALVARRTHVRVGVAASVGAGRHSSMLAREATTAQLLGACEVLLLEGDPQACSDAATIVGALFEPGRHTLSTTTESILDAVNDPTPSVTGGPPVLWRVGGELHRLVDGADAVVGEVLDVAPRAPLPAPARGTLVVAHHDEVPVDALRAAMHA